MFIRTNTAVLAVLFSLATLALAPGQAWGEAEPIAAKPLTQRAVFDGEVSMQLRQKLSGLPEHRVEREDASRLSVVEFTIQPGAVFPWHTHPGTVLVNVTRGDFVFMFAEDCVAREYRPGDAVVDPGNRVHTAYNPGDGETVVVAVFIGVPPEGPLTKPVEDAEGARLDRECDIDREAIAARAAER